MRRWSSVGLAIACVGGAIAFGSTTASAAAKYPPIPPGPITVGASAPLSGAVAAYGTFAKIGLDLAVKEFDVMHPDGIDGHPLKLELVNDNSDVTTAVNVANQLVASKVAAVVEETYNPAAGPQQLAVWAKAKMPVISYVYGLPTGSIKQLSTRYPYIFSPTPATNQYVTNAGRWIQKSGFKKVAFLNDGIQEDTVEQAQIVAGMHQTGGEAKIVASVTIPPTTVDASAAIDKLKASGANLLVIPASGVDYGTIWQAVLASGWSPSILTTPGAWSSGFDAIGSLVSKAHIFYYACAASPAQTFTSQQNELMDAYGTATGNAEVNNLQFISTDVVPLEMLDYAITKYHSTSPAAIKTAIEGIRNLSFLGFKYSFSTTNHYGLTGQYASAVCHMGAPYAGGANKVPVKG
jgi:branched-chain amino acid transport system substrate-binding protein